MILGVLCEFIDNTFFPLTNRQHAAYHRVLHLPPLCVTLCVTLCVCTHDTPLTHVTAVVVERLLCDVTSGQVRTLQSGAGVGSHWLIARSHLSDGAGDIVGLSRRDCYVKKP